MRDDRDVTVIESDSGGGLKWFLLGAAVGAGLGILFAPDAGDRTRRSLVKQGRKLRARAGDVIDDISDEVETRGRKLKQTVTDFAEDVVEEAREGKRTFEHKASGAREEMERRLADARSRARAGVAADGVAEDDEPE